MNRSIVIIAIRAAQSGKVKIPKRSIPKWITGAIKAVDLVLSVAVYCGIALIIYTLLQWLLKQ